LLFSSNILFSSCILPFSGDQPTINSVLSCSDSCLLIAGLLVTIHFVILLIMYALNMIIFATRSDIYVICVHLFLRFLSIANIESLIDLFYTKRGVHPFFYLLIVLI
jgi:hypothetical protein